RDDGIFADTRRKGRETAERHSLLSQVCIDRPRQCMRPGCKPHDKPNSPATETRVCGPPRPRESEEDRTIIAAGCGIGPVCTRPYPPAAARRRALRPHDEASAPFLGTKTRRTEPAEFRCVHRTYAP